MTPTSVGMRCPECARDTTKVRTARSLHPEPTLTYVLIGINVALQVGAVLTGGGLLGPGGLIGIGAVSRPEVAEGEIWRVVTAGFLHAGLLHLFFNMYSLYILGGMLEPVIGRLRFGLIYGVSLLAGSFGALLLEPYGRTVGASGAIFGLMGAAVVVMRRRGISPMESGLGLWIGLNLAITFAVPNISIGGHLGGLVGGAVAAFLLFELRDRARVPAALANALVVGLGALAVTGAIVVSNASA
jgi:membrane associated rhomboid family serine protease